MQILFLIGAVAMIFLGFYLIRNGRLRFTKEDLSNSATTLGLLALFLIMVIWICIKMLHGGK